MDIMKNIESLRKEKGVNQSILASALGMTQGAYSQRVNNGNSNGFEFILEVTNKLGISIIDAIAYPDKLVPIETKKDGCVKCKEKDDIIKNLNDYIKLLKEQKPKRKQTQRP